MHDSEVNQISLYFHCGKCLDEVPDGQSAREWARLEVGTTDDGQVQVWCVRHDIDVVEIDIKNKALEARVAALEDDYLPGMTPEQQKEFEEDQARIAYGE